MGCFNQLDADQVYRHRLNIAELTKNEQDFYVMGIVAATQIDPQERGDKRQRKRSSYSHKGKKVCLYAFLYLENITIYHLKKVKMHVLKNGVVSIEHGNAHKMPHNAFSLDIYQRADNFLRQYLKIGDSSSGSNKPITLTQPLTRVYQEYKEYDKESTQTMGYTTFRVFLRKRFPNVKLSIPLRSATATTSTCHQQEEEEEAAAGLDTNDLIYYDEETTTETGGEEVLEDFEYHNVELEIIGSSDGGV